MKLYLIWDAKQIKANICKANRPKTLKSLEVISNRNERVFDDVRAQIIGISEKEGGGRRGGAVEEGVWKKLKN